MNGYRILHALACMALLGVGFLGPPDVRADTCETRLDTDVPDFPANKPAPIVCDTHGQTRTLTGKASSTAPALAEGQVTGFSFDLDGRARFAIDGVTGDGFGTATELAPTLAEGAAGSFSFDLAGNARVTLGTLLSGEDQTNGLIRTSGGAVRMTQILGTGGAPSTATDATSATSQLPVGKKTFQGIVTCTGTCVQTQKIYGTWLNSATVASSKLVCQLTNNASTTATDSCVSDENFLYWFVVTTATGGTTPLAGIFVQY